MTGSSMMPLLHHMRDRVEIKPGVKVRLGDIVLYDRQDGRYALHRVVRKKKDSFTMVGDNQWYIDDNLAYDQIVGVVTAVERNGKRIARDNVLLKLYSLILTTTAFPRIYLRKAILKLLKPFRQSGNQGQEGAYE